MRTGNSRAPLITGIGSLPHPNQDSALEYSFQHSLPFLPQLPKRSRWEFMVPQALEKLPGLEVDADGSASINLPKWTAGFKVFSESLRAGYQSPLALDTFEPSPQAASCWRPFLWELTERQTPRAKIQLCGPFSAFLSLGFSAGKGPATPDAKDTQELETQITQLIYLRALAMIRKLREQAPKREVLLFLDEPALCALRPDHPVDRVRLTSLKVLIQALKKEATWVGLHCCSDAPWNEILALGPDYLSVDLSQSLESILQVRPVQSQTRLALGAIPTSRSSALAPGSSFDRASALLRQLPLAKDLPPNYFTRPLLLSAACGLGLLDPEFAEETLASLQRLSTEVSETLAGRDLLN